MYHSIRNIILETQFEVIEVASNYRDPKPEDDKKNILSGLGEIET